MTTTPILFSGSSHPELADELASYLGITLGKRHLPLFPDGEIYVEFQEPIQGRDVFLLQSLGCNPNFHIMETFIMLDALKRASAASITLILPYFAYGRQDKINIPGTPITARLIADIFKQAGVDRLITMDLHSEQIEGFFDIPVQHVLSGKVLIPYCKSLLLGETVVVAPDQGSVKIASSYARELNLPLALIDKERMDSFNVEMRWCVGDVKGKTVILPDDMCSTGGTLISAAKICADLGAKRIIAVVAHGLFIGDALDKIEKSPIELLIVTNSIPATEKINSHHAVRVISIASLLGQVIRTCSESLIR